MPPVMRETNRKIINDRKVLIQCPSPVKCAGAERPSDFCGGVIAIELPPKADEAKGECVICKLPGMVRVVENGRWAAYVAQL